MWRSYGEPDKSVFEYLPWSDVKKGPIVDHFRDEVRMVVTCPEPERAETTIMAFVWRQSEKTVKNGRACVHSRHKGLGNNNLIKTAGRCLPAVFIKEKSEREISPFRFGASVLTELNEKRSKIKF